MSERYYDDDDGTGAIALALVFIFGLMIGGGIGLILGLFVF